MHEAIEFWKKHQPDSAQEVWDFALQKGKEEGKQQMVIEFARRLIENGSSDIEVQRYTNLSSVDIRKLRNGV